jgi:hypothetical protein
MNIPCELVNLDCLPCNDDPIRNITSEAPDIDVFIGFADFRGIPPIGILYAQIGCKSICFSAISQRDADDCAIRQARLCAFDTWRDPDPPIPPGPNGPPGGGGSTTPGGIPPSNPRGNRLTTFRNRAQSCTVTCPDGTPFVEEIAAGTIVDFTQALADERAASLCTKRAQVDKLCITSDLITGVCLGSAVSFQLTASGGLPFSDGSYIWNTFGDLPPGLSLDGSTGALSGTPTSSGDFLFQIDVFDANGNSTTKIFTICVMEIVTDTTLSPATEGASYTEPLLQEPAEVSSEQWSLISGTLPPGLTINAAGSITGTPEEDSHEDSPFSFTLQVTATCGTGQVTCQKAFTLEVEPPVDCMGSADAVEDLVWNNIGPAGTLVIAGGDATFSSIGIGSIAVRGTVNLCNPSLDAYDLTFQFDWSQATDFIITGQAVVRLNGVDILGPVENTPGAKQFIQVVSIPSGVNALEVKVNGGGVFTPSWTGGVITIRPLTPP